MKKRLLTMALAAIFIALAAPVALGLQEQATRTTSAVQVDGREQTFDAYNIAGSNYFKLRDIASVLNGTPKQVEIGYDAQTKAVSIETGKPYTATGGEMEASQGEAVQTAVLSEMEFTFNDSPAQLTAYLIGGNNYIKLRDLGSLIDFGVAWDGESRTISIHTDRGYSEEDGTAGETDGAGAQQAVTLAEAGLRRETAGAWDNALVMGYCATGSGDIQSVVIGEVTLDAAAVETVTFDPTDSADAAMVEDLYMLIGEDARIAVQITGPFVHEGEYAVEIELLVNFTDGASATVRDAFTYIFNGSGGMYLEYPGEER